MTTLSTHKLDISIAGKTICTQLDLAVQPGQVWGILGRNGVGKTTLLHTLAGLRPADAGDIKLDQQNIDDCRRKTIAQKMGLLLQHTEDPFPASILETVVSGRHPHISTWQWESANDYQRAEQALATVSLQHMSQRPVNQLSGGERQRVAIATLLTQDPDIFLLDEPNSHLDLKYQINLLSTLCEQAQQNHRIVLMSLHDINLAARFCDHILLMMGDGNVQAGKTEDILKADLLEQAYDHPININPLGDTRVYTPA